MTTTEAELNIKDVYSPQQVTRLAALQGVASFVSLLTVTHPATLIELAEYVIGDDEPFDPVAMATEAREALRAERGYDRNGYDDGEGDWADDEEHVDGYNLGPGAHEDGPLAAWERELLACSRRVVGDITVSDLAGFITLPNTAILEDEDGDVWHHSQGGWSYPGTSTRYIPSKLFMHFSNADDTFDFIVTNPEVLS